MADGSIIHSNHEPQDRSSAIDDLFQHSTMVVQSAVNREDAGSTPAAGAKSTVRADRVKDWRKRTKDRIVTAMGGRCQICFYDRCPEALELHHLDPSEKEISFGQIRANPRAIAGIVDELKKCILLCANCHREVHAKVTAVPADYHRMSESDVAALLTKHRRSTNFLGKGHELWAKADFVNKSIAEIVVEFDVSDGTADRWKRRQKDCGLFVEPG